MYYHSQCTTKTAVNKWWWCITVWLYDSWNITEFECRMYVFCRELELRLTRAIFTGRRWDSRFSSTCVHATRCAYISIGSPAGHRYSAHTSRWAAVTKTCVTVFISSAFIWLVWSITLVNSSHLGFILSTLCICRKYLCRSLRLVCYNYCNNHWKSTADVICCLNCIVESRPAQPFV